jgi:ABC-2 type transport system ATP-binding protein
LKTNHQLPITNYQSPITNHQSPVETIQVINTSKSYGAVKALADANLEIPRSCLYGLIGPDGAGKTTLFRIITTLLIPDEGTVEVFGCNTVRDYRKIRLFTGYMPGRFSLYPDLTVAENLNFYATIFSTRVDRHYDLIKPVYSMLEPFKNRLSRNLSGGMKQKLALCCALIHNPRLLVLDEPTTGVDAVSRKEFWDTLNMLKQSGMTILVSTPYMDEASRCDRVAMMQKGQIMGQDTPGAILAGFKSALYEIRTSERLKAIEILRSDKLVKQAYLFGQSIHVTSVNRGCDETYLNQLLTGQGIPGLNIKTVTPDFEDCFIDAVEQNYPNKNAYE